MEPEPKLMLGKLNFLLNKVKQNESIYADHGKPKFQIYGKNKNAEIISGRWF